MTYKETLDWMFSKLPMYQRQGKTAFKADLSNSILLAKHLNNPQNKIKTVHVAGTNGKGSTCHMLSSILQESGLKVGLFTSPHLKDFRERIRINGKPVSEQFVMSFVEKNKLFLEGQSLSFFEMTSGMAFDYFAKEQVDIAVIEVGLGGRLDSTNIITPEVSVITNIGLDHTQFLGTTLKEIAGEKAGIIKHNVPVVIGEYTDETKEVFKTVASNNQSSMSFVDQTDFDNYKSDLQGDYQKYNIRTTLKTIQVLRTLSYDVKNQHIEKGLLKVVKNTGLQGRWQILQESPKVICDTAHNQEGLKYVMKQLQSETYNKIHMVFGVVKDKDLNSIIGLLPKDAYYYYCKPDVPRGLDADILAIQLMSSGFKGEVCKSVKCAFDLAKLNASVDDIIYVGGSTFVVAEII